MKNRQQLVNRAIKELGLIPLSTQNYASVNELVDGLVESLRERNVAHVVNPTTATATISEGLFLPMAACLAYRAAPEMGISDINQLGYLKAKADMAEMEIQTIKAEQYNGQIIPVDYF